MHSLRTQIKKEIISEFYPPARVFRVSPKPQTGTFEDYQGKVIILCGGMPGLPSKPSLMEMLMKKGYWVFVPRYRGSWESGGSFLQKSPEQDILDIIDQLPKGFKDAWNHATFKVHSKKLYVIGSSFGGTAAVLASRDSRVTKAVAFSPVIDWQRQGKTEPLDWLYAFTKEAFLEGYRIQKRDWNKLQNGTFYNPKACQSEIDGDKLMVIQARDDDVVPFQPAVSFAKKTGCTLKLYKRGGHMSMALLMKERWYKMVMKFLKGV